jgi:drug/metabolite transporter (DMT)-like permease
MPASPFGSFGSNAYLILFLTTLMWAGNAVAGRMVVGEASPMVVVMLRWLIACAILLAIRTPDARIDWSILKTRWLYVVLMGFFGFTGFNALFYVGAHSTTAVNMAIIQGGMPAFILIGGTLFLRQKVGALQLAGGAITLLGVATLATKGYLPGILGLAMNFGDILMLIACVFYAAYTLGVRSRPPGSSLAFFALMAAVAAVTSVPLLAAEIALGHAQWPTPKGWLIILYIAVFPSLLAQLLFLRGVDLIGPMRAGLFLNLVPVMGPLLAVVILGEPFVGYHAAALALVLAGIAIAEWRRG